MENKTPQYQFNPEFESPELDGPGIIDPQIKDQFPELTLNPLNMKDERSVIVKNLIYNMENSGFLSLENVDGYDQNQLYQMSQWLFGLSEQAKKQIYQSNWNPENPNQYRGFVPVIKNDPSYQQFYEIGDDSIFDNYSGDITELPILYQKNPYPQGDKNFVEALQKYQSLFFNLSITLVQYLAEGLNLPTNYFDQMFLQLDQTDEVSLSTFRFLYYPERTEEQIKENLNTLSTDDKVPLTTPPHQDNVFMTILTTFNYYGLQILHNDIWHLVKPQKNTIIVNLGQMLSRITGYQVQATLHRVVDIGTSRFSIPYFLEPKFQGQVPNDVFKEQQDHPEDFLEYGPWIIEAINEYVEYRNIKYIKK